MERVIVNDNQDLIKAKEVYSRLVSMSKSFDNDDNKNSLKNLVKDMFNFVDGKLDRFRVYSSSIELNGEVKGYTIQRSIFYDSVVNDLCILSEDLTMAYWRTSLNHKTEYTTMQLIEEIKKL